MKSLCESGSRPRENESSTAIGRATSSANAMNTASRAVEPLRPVVTMRAPNTVNVTTWKSALRLSLNSRKSSGISWRATASAIPPTKTAISPLAQPACSAIPKAARASPSAYTPSYASTRPAVTESTEIERTAPRSHPERAAATTSRPPTISSASGNPTSIGRLCVHGPHGVRLTDS